MIKLEDDVFSFGFMILESLVGPSVSARKGAFLTDELVWNSDLKQIILS